MDYKGLIVFLWRSIALKLGSCLNDSRAIIASLSLPLGALASIFPGSSMGTVSTAHMLNT